ncbi:MAG: phosphoribosylaminoimidazole-succinocarboxamide synthase [Roseivirga sp.]|jgi:phosphoribosylaminoimidazole-succinocarboxamide synthase
MTDDVVKSISDRYIELFEKVTGDKFERHTTEALEKRIESNILEYLKNK